MTSVFSEYIEVFSKYVKQYGKNTAVLMQVGSFYEMYGIENDKEKLGNCSRLSNILNVALTRKNKKIAENNKNNPLMLGFPCLALEKYVPILLNMNFTIIIVDQNKTQLGIKRNVSKVISPSTNIDGDDDNYLALVYIEMAHVGISVINVLTGNSCVHECYSKPDDTNASLDETISFIKRYKPREIVVCGKNNSIIELAVSYLGLDVDEIMYHSKIIDKVALNINYQNAVLGNVFNNNTMLSNIELLDLEHMPYALISYVLLLEFVYNHSPLLLKKISIPKIYLSLSDNLVLSTNTVDQLNIIGSTSKKTLFAIINKCSTCVGTRLLQKRMLEPICCIKRLEELYQQIEEFAKIFSLGNVEYKCLESMLNKISDIEKLQRRMSIGVMHPNELASLHASYEIILQLNALLEKNIPKTSVLKNVVINNITKKALSSFVDECNNIFIMENMLCTFKNAGTSMCLFKKDVFSDVDILNQQIYDEIKNIESIASQVKKMCGDVKVEYAQNVGYYIIVSNAKAKHARNNNIGLVFQQNKTYTKITSSKTDASNMKIVAICSKLEKLTKKLYKRALDYLSTSYQNMFDVLVSFVSQIDVIKSNYKTSTLYNYCRPTIDESKGQSFIDAKDLRHPIIERLDNGVEYVANDIAIGKNGLNGIVLYSMNSCGKTSILKACGISVILAQMGCFVPASSYVFYPFKCIMTRIISEDNIVKGQSSFVAEMSELRAILKRAVDGSTLVLADEITHGTEHTSGSSIFISSVETLAKRNVNFLFTTHLHNVYPFIKNIQNVEVYHLSVKFVNDKIVFERKLSEGPGGSMYGLEVCEFLGMDADFIARAFQIRNMITPDKNDVTLTIKMSKYNNKKHVQLCEICGYSPKVKTDMPLDVHHINKQSMADCNNMIKGVHKNARYNLVALCKQCHVLVHKNEIFIQGYKNTTNGIILDYIKHDT